MKKCPYCHADIQDNARFCVFCMSSLQEKEKIETKQENNKRWLYIIAAFLLLALVFGISIFALSKNKANNTHNNSMQSYVSSTHSYLYTSDLEPGNNNNFNNPIVNPSKSENINSENTASMPNNSSNSTSNNNSSQTATDVSSSSNANTTVSSQSAPTQSNSNSSNVFIEQTPDENQPEPTVATYLYRDATAADCYTEGNIPAYPVEDVIVIIGVSSVSSDGVYTIPETIDGKKVGGIMPNAFCDSNISSTVKKVIVPASVKTIWQNAFADCYNLTDIYLCGKTINIFENSFADLSKRNSTLTIHCSRECKTFGFYYYMNIAKNYNANYQEWNGGEIE